jgi:hypothetical protein
MTADQHLLFLFLTEAVIAADTVRTPPTLLTHADISLMLIQTFIVEVLIALAAVEKLDTFKVGLVLADLACFGFTLLADEKLCFLSQNLIVIAERHLKLRFSLS